MLKTDTDFPILLNGKQAGIGNVLAGSELDILGIAPPNVTLVSKAYGGGSKSVPIDSTDLVERAKDEMRKEEGATAAPQVATPAPATIVKKTTVATMPVGTPTALLDELVFGDDKSESSHELKAVNSEVFTGGLDDSARRLLTGGPTTWQGGNVTFKMKIDPNQQNYFTIRLWGSDATETRLVLYCEGKQVGYRHLGDIPVLDASNSSPAYPGRFIYITTPLPIDMLKGKSEVNCEIEANGGIFGYAQEFEKFQVEMKEPSRGIYRVTRIQTNRLFPRPRRSRGTHPQTHRNANATTMPNWPGSRIRSRTGSTGCFPPIVPSTKCSFSFLGAAYNVKWCPAYHDAKVIDQVVKGVDALYNAWVADPTAVMEDEAKVTYNPGWFGMARRRKRSSRWASP